VQVHEKSILLPLLPITLLSMDLRQNMIRSMTASLLSMYPLLKKDGLPDAYWGLILIYGGLSAIAFSVLPTTVRKGEEKTPSSKGILLWTSSIGFLCIHILSIWYKPPLKYPYLWDAIMVTWGFLHFVEMIVRLYYKHFNLFINSAPF
jgi:alpha-1,3-glucosyltransferase